MEKSKAKFDINPKGYVSAATLNEYSVDAFGVPRRKLPGYKRPERHTLLDGYTGYFEKPKDADGWNDDNHVLDAKLRRVPIRGYTGFRPQSRGILGVPTIPSVEEQLKALNPSVDDGIDSRSTTIAERDYSKFRQFGKHMDRMERYDNAKERLHERGQSQEMLLKLVQAKLSGRVNSYAEQLISLRRMFEAFDVNRDGSLDENEFHECLERINIQYDDIQSLALFALFDPDCTG